MILILYLDYDFLYQKIMFLIYLIQYQFMNQVPDHIYVSIM